MFEEKDPIFDEENQKKLIEKIQNAPDCMIFGVSRFSQRRIRNSLTVAIMTPIVVILLCFIINNQVFTVVSLMVVLPAVLIICGFLSYLNHSHKYFKTFVSEFGIAKDTKWEDGALPWEKIQYIEIKNKGDDIDLILFRSGSLKLGYRNSHFATRLSLEIISEYVGGIERWHMFDDLKETSETTDFDILYMHPDIDKSEGLKKLEDVHLMEWIGEQDYDADKTREHPSAKSDDVLYTLIMDDPRCECLYDTGRFARVISNFKVTFIMLFVAIAASIGGMFIVQFSGIIYGSVVILFILMFYGMCKSDEKLVMSPIGIARFIFGSPEALEWQHVEYIDLTFEKDILVQVEFFGNKRRIFCPSHRYKEKFSLESIRKYLPHLDDWKKKTRDQWPEDTFRLVRPDV